MPFEPGLVHTPLTPFRAADRRIDFDLYGRMIDFHLRHGAQALAVPMHAGESVSLTDDERRALIKFAVERAGKRAPVIAHVSDAGTGIAAALARARAGCRRRGDRRHHAVLLDAAAGDGPGAFCPDRRGRRYSVLRPQCARRHGRQQDQRRSRRSS